MGRAMALLGFQIWSHSKSWQERKISYPRTPDLHQQTQTSTYMRSALKSYHTESLRLLIVSLLQGHIVLSPSKFSDTRLNCWCHFNFPGSNLPGTIRPLKGHFWLMIKWFTNLNFLSLKIQKIRRKNFASYNVHLTMILTLPSLPHRPGFKVF